ncbi:MAG: hypothetical protein JW719_10965 [Pirellulales bacterium]|nr:hypothetical protein [Pirellulales bacterium]
MEARIFPKASLVAARRLYCWLLLAGVLFVSMGAGARSRNFIVETGDPALDRQIAQAAETYRRDLAIAWLGKEMPDWAAPCMMTVRVSPTLGAGGATTFMFNGGEVYGWRMSIQGSRQRIFDSVLPHEITHMVLASHFRRPLPRWADEGAATSVECAHERDKHYRMLQEFLCTRRGIPFSQMFAMTEYPPDVMPLYAQGLSLADFLIQQGGRRKFIVFLEDGLASNQWSSAIDRHYGLGDLGRLQNQWLAWIREGHPRLESAPRGPAASPETLLADASAGRSNKFRNTKAPARSVRAPGEQLAMAGRRPWPEPNLIHHVPRGAAPGDQLVLSGKLVPLAHPESRGAAPAESDLGSPCPSCPQMARPQSPEPARQIILQWSKPGEPVHVPMCGQQGMLR